MTSPESSHPNAVGAEKLNRAEAQDKDFKIAIMNMLKDLDDDINKSFNKHCET